MDRRAQLTSPSTDDRLDEERRLADAERRDGARGRTLLAGRVLYGPEHRLSLDVRLRDLSDTGARAVLPTGHPCPAAGVLLVPRSSMAYRMRTIWQRGDQAGLAFDVACNLEAPDLPAEFRPVRRLWVELTLR